MQWLAQELTISQGVEQLEAIRGERGFGVAVRASGWD